MVVVTPLIINYNVPADADPAGFNVSSMATPEQSVLYGTSGFTGFTPPKDANPMCNEPAWAVRSLQSSFLFAAFAGDKALDFTSDLALAVLAGSISHRSENYVYLVYVPSLVMPVESVALDVTMAWHALRVITGRREARDGGVMVQLGHPDTSNANDAVILLRALAHRERPKGAVPIAAVHDVFVYRVQRLHPMLIGASLQCTGADTQIVTVALGIENILNFELVHLFLMIRDAVMATFCCVDEGVEVTEFSTKQFSAERRTVVVKISVKEAAAERLGVDGLWASRLSDKKDALAAAMEAAWRDAIPLLKDAVNPRGVEGPPKLVRANLARITYVSPSQLRVALPRGGSSI